MKNFYLFKIFAFALYVFFSVAHAGENEIRKSLQSKYPNVGSLPHIVKTPYSDLYEVVVDGQLLYTDAKAQFIFDGSIIDATTRQDLSKERRRHLFKINFDELPLHLAIKKVKGNGKRKLALFTDPNCSFCKKLEFELNKITNVTIYLYLYPTFPGSDEIVRSVLCSKDPYKTWEELMLHDKTPKKLSCNTPQTPQTMALADKLRINGTPNMIFYSGMQTPGYASAAAVENSLNEAKID